MKLSRGFPSILLCFLAVPGSATFGQTTTTKGATVPTDVHQLYLDDQSDRTGDRAVAPYGADVNSRDAMRRVEAKLLLGAGKITAAQDFHDAAYIFQHGDTADDYLLAHILAVEAIVKGDASSKWISAATLDRYLQSIGQSQVFGTQYSDTSYQYVLQHKNDPSALTKPEANEKGMTQEPYYRNLVADPLRLDSACQIGLSKESILKNSNLAAIRPKSFHQDAPVSGNLRTHEQAMEMTGMEAWKAMNQEPPACLSCLC